MNDLLFYLLILALLYYFFYYLPKQKQPEIIKPSTPLTHSQATQTINPNPPPTENNQELEPLLDHLLQEIKKLNQALK